MGLNGYTVDGQDPKIVQRVLSKLRRLLGDDEVIHYVAVQRKGALNLFPDSIVATDQHLFLCEYTKMGLDMHIEVLPWNKMRTIQPERIGAGMTLKIIPETEIDYIIENIPEAQAERLLDYARKQAASAGSVISIKKEKLAVTEEPVAVEETVEIPETNSPEPENKNNPFLEKLYSLYLRQRITRSEYESRSKKHQLEN